MIASLSLILGTAAAVARAAQPGAVEPVAAPMRNLTWGQLNFLHTTDTHGWLGGHFQEPQYSADWGDYISFTHQMRKLADDKGSDLLLVDTGDRVEGNGLFDASTPKGLYQYDIYAQQDVDIICTGNHELYQHYSIEREHNTTLPNFKENYVASNLDYVDPETGNRSPMAQRFRRFKTKNQGLDIIAFGFIFDFIGNANNSAVQRVEDTVKEKWFLDVLKEKPDVFVVTGHVGLRMEEFEVIFKAMRQANWHTPIVFFGGHAHVRDARRFDSMSVALASGRYMETVGWMSVDGLKKTGDVETEASPTFTRTYIDNNVLGMYHHTGLDESSFHTDKGREVTKMIDSARKELELDRRFGCAPRDYWMSRARFNEDGNIYKLLMDEVFPDIIVNEDRRNESRLAIMNTGGIRFDIFKGAFTRDTTYIVSPFVSEFRYVPDVPYEIARRIIGILNDGSRIWASPLLQSEIFHVDNDVPPRPNKFMSAPEQQAHPELKRDAADNLVKKLLTSSAGLPPPEKPEYMAEPQRDGQTPLRSQPDLIAGYTTKDDFGDDGDDTVHEPLEFYYQANAFQSDINFPPNHKEKPETVDVVFIDFIQPWIIPALKFSGGDYSDKDVLKYMEGTFTSKLAEWVGENWQGDC
ncbi:ser Thr protein phosphatase family [Emericellopsis cladophorae]|uniref:Ser Thr protein phosphatase family n=1 Tax=Emericellopsis cladophorae TaxID=2686198 RepID=A0A9Q0BDJ0_9HYPO|nr:ser Thr protein phosphatase family [Emericellopsis cladophorae]KAI6781937.1 ser Thr protein phosphatase family [Emericellopsis cladophorae]